MSIPSFYEPTLLPGHHQFTLSEQSSKHSTLVLRMKIGDPLLVCNGKGGLFNATVIDPRKKDTLISIDSNEQIKIADQKIILGISLLKNAVRLEWLFEKATEMGVHTIVPIICSRTIHERFKLDRMQNILQSAMIQSKQAWLPDLMAPLSYSTFLSTYAATQKLIAHCELSKKDSIKSIVPGNDCILLIGPEGDFTPAEIEQAISHHYTPIHLGPTRLRTETAGIFALSVLKNF